MQRRHHNPLCANSWQKLHATSNHAAPRKDVCQVQRIRPALSAPARLVLSLASRCGCFRCRHWCAGCRQHHFHRKHGADYTVQHDHGVGVEEQQRLVDRQRRVFRRLVWRHLRRRQPQPRHVRPAFACYAEHDRTLICVCCQCVTWCVCLRVRCVRIQWHRLGRERFERQLAKRSDNVQRLPLPEVSALGSWTQHYSCAL